MNSAALLFNQLWNSPLGVGHFFCNVNKEKKRKCEFHLYITIEVLLCAIHIICTLAHVYKILKQINILILGVHTQTFLLMPVCSEKTVENP